MADIDNLERRVEQLERQQRDLQTRMSATEIDQAAPVSKSPDKPKRGTRVHRVFWGIFVIAIGLLWLGQTYGIEWIESIKLWPVALIVFGVYMIFGDRAR